MSTKTQPELIDQVLLDLMVLAAGQTAEIEDTAKVKAIIPSALDLLRATETFYLGNADSIPSEAFLPLAHVIAWESRTAFAITGDLLQTLMEAKESAIKALKIMGRGRATGLPLQTEYI